MDFDHVPKSPPVWIRMTALTVVWIIEYGALEPKYGGEESAAPNV